MTTYCRLTFEDSAFKYIFWGVSFFATSVTIRFIHECLHGLYAVLTGGSAGAIHVFQWVFIYPILMIDVYGGNPFWVIEGTLITTWLISLLIIYLTSFSFLERVTDYCRAADLSGWLMGIRLAGMFEAVGQAVYAMPNFVFFNDDSLLYGDGTYMYTVFEQIGYPGEFQYIFVVFMLLGAVAMIWYTLRCDPVFCSSCRI